MNEPLLRMVLRDERDVFVLRQRGREVAAAVGMEHQDQVRVATALSEIGRQAPGAVVTFFAVAEPRPHLLIVLAAQDLGSHSSEGVAAAARLMDEVRMEDERIVLTRRLPGQVAPERLAAARTELAQSLPTTALDELSVQNQQLVAALEEVQAHRDELLQLNSELEETNRGVMALYGQLSEELEQTNQGVVALYAELDERSAQLREANEAKSRFLANVSHELRAPVTAIIGLARLLLDARSEPLTTEQTHQLHLVQGSAADLLARVNDLLDLAKAESNRIEPSWGPVDLAAVFGQLRGTLRPLARAGVELTVAEPPAADLVTDELLLTQILRNLLVNALKFTDAGTVDMGAWVDRDRLHVAIADTGIGIPFAEQRRVFEEFHQVRGVHQAGGTGLGLPYARRLAGLLGGGLSMVSEPGEGSTFTVDLPLHPPRPEEDTDLPSLGRVLIVDDDPAARHLLRQALAGITGQISEAADVRAGLAIAGRERPALIFLDLRMPGGDGTELLAALAAAPELAGIPVVIVTAADPAEFPAGALDHAAAILAKEDVSRRTVADVIVRVVPSAEAAADILVVDDSPSKRYVITSWLRRDGHRVTEAATGAEALALLREVPTELVVLDVRLPDIDGFEVAERIKSDPLTRAIPVIHISATAIHAVDRTQGLTRGADAYLSEPIDPDELLATVQAMLRYYRARHRAERLAGRLTRLVGTTTAINTATTLPELLQLAAAGAARIFDGPAVVAAASGETGALAVQVDAVDGVAVTRPALPAQFAHDPLGGRTGTELFLQEDGPWWPGPVWRVVARAKVGREPLHIAVPAAGFGEDDADVLRQLGQAMALAVEALRSYDEERRTALTLQQSMLPASLPAVDGYDIAVRYQPASEHVSVGGDFYEVVHVDGQLVAAIGDVAGHSLRAATIMAEVRHALRAYLAEGHAPGPTLDRLNRMMLRFLPEEIATMVLMRIDPATGETHLANAGHPPPLRIRDGRVTLVESRVALLGVAITHDAEVAFTLERGETLVLVTDGLIEARGHTFNEGLDRLCAAVADVGDDLERFCDRLLAELSADTRDDDVALLVIRRG